MSRIERRPSSGRSPMGKKSLVGGTRPSGKSKKGSSQWCRNSKQSRKCIQYPYSRLPFREEISDSIRIGISHRRSSAKFTFTPSQDCVSGAHPPNPELRREPSCANRTWCVLGRRRNTTVPVPVRCLWTLVPDLMRALLAGGFLVVDRGRCTFPACACCTAGHAAHVRSAHEGPN